MENNKDPLLTIQIDLHDRNGKKIDSIYVRAGVNLWVSVRKYGLPIGSACSGVGVCGACHLKISSIHNENSNKDSVISKKTEFEISTLTRNQKPADERLACLCRVYGPISVQSDYW